MRKYPLSKKAVAIALATVMATTPFVTLSGDTPFSNAVYADEHGEVDSTQDVAERITAIYQTFMNSEISQDGKDAVGTLVDTLADSDWEELLTQDVYDAMEAALDASEVEGLEKDLSQILNDLVKVFQSDPNTILADRMAEFEDNYTDEFKVLFGDEFTLHGLFGIIADLENLGELNFPEADDESELSFSDVISAITGVREDLDNSDLDLMRDKLVEYGMTATILEDAARTTLDNSGVSNEDFRAMVVGMLDAAEVTVTFGDQTPPPPPGGGGGIAPPADPGDDVVEVDDSVTDEETVTDDAGQTTNRVRVNPAQLASSIENVEDLREVRIPATRGTSDRVEVALPTSAIDAVRDRNPNARIVIEADDHSISLNVNQLDSQQISSDLEVPEGEEAEVVMATNEVEDTDDVLGTNNRTAKSPVVEFTVTATFGDQTRNLNRYTRFVERSIKGAANFDPATDVVVRLNADGTITGVPTRVSDDRAFFRSFSNSRYAVIENVMSYTDVEEHWGVDHITKLSNQMIFEGYVPGDFRPENSTTRAEFAALITRSLGLTADEEYSNEFTDVPASHWAADSLAAAVDYELIEGYTNGEFRPENHVTREEAATIVSRAMDLLDEIDFVEAGAPSATQFVDASDIQNYAFDAVNRLTEAGLLQGTPTGLVNPGQDSKRAEIAAMLERFLIKSEFINE